MNTSILKHYTALLFYRYDLFALCSGIFATTATLYSLGKNNELMAIEVSGTSISKCFKPFLLFGVCLAITGYAMNEYGIPNTYKWLKKKHFRNQISLHTPFMHEYLQDGSHIAYMLDNAKKEDFYWIRHSGDIWHAKTISEEPSTLVGHQVDHFQKSATGKLVKTDSYDTYYFPPLLSKLQESVHLEPVMNLSDHFRFILSKAQRRSKDHAPIVTQFSHKLANPWFPLLALSIAFVLFYTFSFLERPLWLCFSSILLFLVFYSLSKTFIILGENYMLSPWIPFAALPLLAFTTIGWRIKKLDV